MYATATIAGTPSSSFSGNPSAISGTPSGSSCTTAASSSTANPSSAVGASCGTSSSFSGTPSASSGIPSSAYAGTTTVDIYEGDTASANSEDDEELVSLLQPSPSNPASPEENTLTSRRNMKRLMKKRNLPETIF